MVYLSNVLGTVLEHGIRNGNTSTLNLNKEGCLSASLQVERKSSDKWWQRLLELTGSIDDMSDSSRFVFSGVFSQLAIFGIPLEKPKQVTSEVRVFRLSRNLKGEVVQGDTFQSPEGHIISNLNIAMLEILAEKSSEDFAH